MPWPDAPEMLDPPVAIGNTPWLHLSVTLNGIEHEIRLKEEYRNAFGSIKDRVAWKLLADAMVTGTLRPAGRVVDASSGNYGIALAALGTLYGVDVEIVVSEGIPETTAARIREAGASLHIARRQGDETLHAARISLAGELAKRTGAVFLDQYNNPGNPASHRDWTAPEIFTQERLDALFLSGSSGGTAAGVSQYLIGKAIACQLFIVDSPASDILSSAERPEASLLVPGMGSKRRTRFLPVPGSYSLLRVWDHQAFACYRLLREADGLSLGLSSCGVLAGVIDWLSGQDRPRKIAMLGTDRHDKYLNHVEACLKDAQVLSRVEGYMIGYDGILRSMQGLWRPT
nr:pyridoxal-phosphate dependent enzyme [Labrys sp. LIt4]